MSVRHWTGGRPGAASLQCPLLTHPGHPALLGYIHLIFLAQDHSGASKAGRNKQLTTSCQLIRHWRHQETNKGQRKTFLFEGLLRWQVPPPEQVRVGASQKCCQHWAVLSVWLLKVTPRKAKAAKHQSRYYLWRLCTLRACSLPSRLLQHPLQVPSLVNRDFWAQSLPGGHFK